MIEILEKILLIFSDGGPMDTATSMTNHAEYLDQHLIDSVAEQNTLIFGLGLGVDLSKYYTNNMTINDECENIREGLRQTGHNVNCLAAVQVISRPLTLVYKDVTAFRPLARGAALCM